MKKLSKILVIVLTLAMLLGVIVVSAFAQNNDIDFIKPDGTVDGSYTTLVDAIAAANANVDDGDITIRINKDMSLDGAVAITRPATYGKVIIDLNGYTLSTSVAPTKTHSMEYVPSSDYKGYLVNAKVNVKVEAGGTIGDAKAYSVYGLELTGAYLESDETKTVVTTYEAGKTYVCTAVSGNAIPTANLATGIITVADGASLEVDGNGGVIYNSKTGNIFEIDENCPGAKLVVRDVKYGSGQNHYFLKINSGSATLDGCVLTRTNEFPAIRHGGNAELNILNSYITQSGANAANTGLIAVEGTGTENAADGYHIEIKNSTIISASTMIAGVHPNLSSGVNTTFEMTAGNAADGTKRYYWAQNEGRIDGVDYVNTGILFENCNVENVNYTTRAKNDNGGIVGIGANVNVDFKKSNLFVAQLGTRFVFATRVPAYVNLYDCYVEFTGKGYLHNAWAVSFANSVSGATVSAFDTEFRVGELIKANEYKTPNAIAITPVSFTQNMVFAAGCIFDNACAPAADKVAQFCELNSGENETYILGANSDKLSYLNFKEFAFNSNVGTALAPHIVMANGAGSIGTISGSSVEFTNMSQGRFTVETEADGNKYLCYDPTYVHNDMSAYDYVPLADDEANISSLVTGATGAWKVGGVYTYVNTDNDDQAEYVLVKGNWVEVPDAYTKLYDISGGYFNFDINNHNKATEYDYISYSFDYKTPAEGENGFAFSTGIQWRRNFAGAGGNDQTNRQISFSNTGALTVNGKTVSLEKDTWYTITVLVEVKETYAGENAGYYYADNMRSDMTFANSVAHVFINGVKFTSYVCGFQNAIYICGLRGATVTSSAACTTNSKFKVDNLRRDMYAKGYSSAELDAVLASANGKLSDWPEYVANIENDVMTERPADVVPAAKVTWKNRDSWTPSSSHEKTMFYPGTESGEDVIYKLDSSVYYGNIADAIKTVTSSDMSIELLADAKKVLVNAPIAVKTNGYEFTYFSNEYKGTEADGIVTFTKASESDLVEITYGYGDEIFTETFIDGGYFWLDTSKIPESVTKFDADKAQDVALYFNGKKLDAINLADYEAGYKISGKASYVFSYELERQYGWVITDNSGKFLYAEDKGDTYAELVNRVKTIENIYWDPFKNDEGENLGADLVLDENGNVTGFVSGYGYGDYGDIAHTLDGYTIKLFKDYTHTAETPVETLMFNSFGQANKVINYDLNGHTVKYGGVIADYRKTMYAWEYDSNGAVVQLHGITSTGDVDNTVRAIKTEGNKLYIVVNKAATNTYAINVISSAKGANIITDSVLVLNTRREHLRYYTVPGITSGSANRGEKITDNYGARINIGNPVADANSVGPDANVINVQTTANVISGSYSCYNVLRNLNIVSELGTVVYSVQGHNDLYNCNIISTAKSGKGILSADSTNQRLNIVNCNLLSYNPQNLYDKAGCRDAASASKTGDAATWYCSVVGSRLYNLYINANSTAFGTIFADDYELVVNVGKDCYYNLAYPEGSKVELRETRKNDSAKYEANVYANETFKINGVDYTFTYKVTDEVYTVTWQDETGAKELDVQKYAKNGNAIYIGGIVKVDALSATKYVFDTFKVTENATVKANSSKLIPNFLVTDSLVLEINLVHKIRIYKDVDGKDILDYITKISLGDTVYFDKAKEVNLLENGTTDGGEEYYYILLNVKSNEIAKDNALAIDFVNLSETEIKATQNFSILDYIKRALANCTIGDDTYNLLTSVLAYGSAAYDYDGFPESNADDKAKLDAFANQYPVSVEIPDAESGVAGQYIDVEFVLDENVEYRFYINSEKMFEIYNQIPDADSITEYELVELSTIVISYYKYNGAKLTVEALKIENEGGRYWVDFVVPAYDFQGPIEISIINGTVGIADTVTYSIANYYADAKKSGETPNESLLALVEGLYAYTSSAKAYVISKNAQ